MDASESEVMEGPVERAQMLGLRSVSVADLLAIACAEDETQAAEILPQATALAVNRNSASAFGSLSHADLDEIRNMSPWDSMRILAAMEAGRKAANSAKGAKKAIESIADAKRAFKFLEDEPRENVCAMLLSTKNTILGIRTIHVGTLDLSLVGAREVFREAIREGAAGVIVAHNHPSGDPTPSPEDYRVTEILKQAGDLLDVKLIDHLVIGHGRVFSFKEAKVL